MEKDENLNSEATKFEEPQQSMADLMQDYGANTDIAVGKEIEVTIIAQNSDGFLADIGIKAEGLIPKEDYEGEAFADQLKIGAKVKVKIMDMRGQPRLSCKQAMKKDLWDKFELALKDSRQVSGVISKAIKGGFIVETNGVKAFLPTSQLDTRFVKDSAKFIGQTCEFSVIEFNKSKEKITVSRRKILEEQRDIKKKAMLETLAQGQILEGTVSNFARLKNEKSRVFGAFIDLGGVDGLLHIDEMAWYKVTNPEEILHVGETVKVQVIKFDKENEKISLSLKALITSPWAGVTEKYPVNLVIKGKVASVVEYGAFVELEKGIDAFLHSSEYSWNDSEYAFKKEVKKGLELEAQIISVDEADRKIALSVKKMSPNPWDDMITHYCPGTKAKGIVANLTPFGAFVKLPEGVEGLVHISDFSWTKKVNHPADVIKKGDEIDVVVLEVNPQKEQISLSIKHTVEDPYKQFKRGAIVKGKVTKVSDFGYFVEVAPGIEALIKHSEASVVKPEESQRDVPIFKEGDEVEAKITKFDPKDRKIEASIKRLEIDREKDLVKKYANQNENLTLGDLLTSEGEEEEEKTEE